jgi:hypothetical protein
LIHIECCLLIWKRQPNYRDQCASSLRNEHYFALFEATRNVTSASSADLRDVRNVSGIMSARFEDFACIKPLLRPRCMVTMFIGCGLRERAALTRPPRIRCTRKGTSFFSLSLPTCVSTFPSRASGDSSNDSRRFANSHRESDRTRLIKPRDHLRAEMREITELADRRTSRSECTRIDNASERGSNIDVYRCRITRETLQFLIIEEQYRAFSFPFGWPRANRAQI